MMKLGLYALMGTLGFALLGCQPSVEYSPAQERAAAVEKGSEEKTADQTAVPQEEAAPEEVAAEEPAAEEEVAEEEQVAEQPAAPAPTPLTNADLLAMDTVVITAVAKAQDNANNQPEETKWFSDVGALKVTTANDVTDAAVAPAGSQLAGAAAFMVKAGQKVEFCNHASSTDTVRIHAANGSAFPHWGAGAVLQPGECSFGANQTPDQGFQDTINANAVGNTPGNNLYNHQQNEDSSPIFLQVMQ